MEMEKEELKKIKDKSFTEGFWYAVQQVAIYHDIHTAVWLIGESGIGREELEEAQKASDYENETMESVLNKAFDEA